MANLIFMNLVPISLVFFNSPVKFVFFSEKMVNGPTKMFKLEDWTSVCNFDKINL